MVVKHDYTSRRNEVRRNQLNNIGQSSFRFSLSNTSDEELQAQDLVKLGQIDQAITVYEQLIPESARILRIIGTLYAQRKGDYDLAIVYYEQALQIQDEVNNH